MNPPGKSAQERGMMLLAATVRQLTPPELEVLMVIYDPKTPESVSSVMVTCDSTRTVVTNESALARGRIAAQAFAHTPPNTAGFESRS